MAPQRKNVLISVIVLAAFVFGTMGFAVSAQAVSPSPSVSTQLASIARAIESLLHLLEVAKIKALSGSPYLAQVTGSGSCPSGYHYMSDTGGYCMSDTSSTTCQPTGGGATYTCPTGSTTTSPSPSPSSSPTSSCSSSLIALLGDGCHWMYTDTYCDGPMTKSAKTGDTATTPGCSSSGGTTTTTSTTGTGGLYTTISGSDIVLNWTDFYTGEDEYRIERRITGGTWTQIGTIAFLAGGTGTYRDTAVPSGSYEYHVKPCTSSGCFGESNTAYATAGSSTTTTTTTITTGGLYTTISGSDVVLNWTDFYTGENEYRIERRIGSTGIWSQVGTIAFLAGGTGTYRDTAVPSGSYEYHVKPCTSSGCFGESNTAYATVGGSSTSTIAPTTATAAPVIGNILVSNITANSATIGWTTDISANSKVEYGIGTPTQTIADGSFVTNHTIYLNALAASTTYTYNIISENQDYYRTTFSNKKFSTLSSGGTTATTTTTSSCTASLIALLGDGCHWMYTDTYCDGPMAKSAKTGDTVATSGCSSSSWTTTSSCSVNTSQSSCTANTGCGWMSGSGFSYCDTKSSYAGDANSCPGFSYSRWDTSGRRYCQMNQIKACQYTYPDYLDTAKYSTASCSAQNGGNIATSTQSGVPITPSGLSATLQSNGDVNLSWNDYATNENEYKIEWKNLSGSWIVIGSSPIVYGGVGSYVDRPSSGRMHEYRVRACNTAGCSRESNFATVTIGGESKIPVITSLSLRAGPIGTRVTITGTGFAAVGNRINFGTGVLMDIPSPDGMTLVFAVPEDQVPLCAVTEPRCLLPAPYNPVKLGTYTVSVTTADVTSAWFSFAVTEREASVFAVDPSVTYPKSGQTAVETSARIRVKLTREFDSRSMVQEFFRLTKDTTPTIRVNGTFAIVQDGFEFIPGQGLEPNANYTYSVLSTLKDRSGMSLPPFTASFTTGSGAGRLSGTVSGKINDSDGKAVARATVYIFSYQTSFWRIIESDASGLFQAVVPAGSYFIEVHPPLAAIDLNRATPRQINIVGGETQNLVLTLDRTVKIITGTVTFSNGKPVTDAEVGAYASETKQWQNVAVDANGRYTLTVGGGVWFIGVHPRDTSAGWSWNEPPPRVTFLKDQSAETKTINLVVPISDTTITVTTIDDTGAVLGDTGVVVDSGRYTQVSGSPSFDFIPPEFRVSDSSGKAVFTLRAGVYYVRAYLASDRGYFNPEEQQVTISGGDSKEIKMVFRKKQQTRASMIRGVTLLEQGIPVDAFVWAWSERGGFVSTKSDENGVFAVTVLPNDRWHIGAGKEYKEFGYKSPELIIDMKNEPVSVEITLIKQVSAPLPPTVNVTQSAQRQVVAQATDGTQMTLPPASATSTNTVQLEINPTLEAPAQAGTKVMSTVYDVTLHDEGGKKITSLAEKAELIIPYSEEELKNQGVSEDAIVPSFFDEKIGAWVTLDDYTIDKERNIIIARVDHLTRFAITAAADITPPSAPTTIKAQALGAGKIKVTWKNPAKDFNYAKIYRSLKEKELGVVRGAAIRGEQFMDEEGISENTAYYYTVRAIDPAGNESVNTVQVRIVAAGTSGHAPSANVSVRPMGSLLRTLRRGIKGDDVKLLQQALTADGVYSDEATGFFGKLTEAAVIRFQEKYAAEILKPAGLNKGSGLVGPGTRKKINSILGQ